MFEDSSWEWRPASIDEVRTIVEEDLKICDPEQIATFKRYEIELFRAPIVRYGKTETVVVVARREDEVIYWEDVEEGFEVSPLSSDGQILQHWCNHDDLGFALNEWIEGRACAGKFGPAEPMK